jgi:hypothetical protein
MRKVCASVVISFLLTPTLFHSVLSAEPSDSKVVHLPIMFEKNMGQVSSSYLFMSRHRNVEALFSRAGVDILVPEGKGSAQIRIRFTGWRPNVAPEGNDPLQSVTNYLQGNDSSRWIRGVPAYAEIEYPEIYSGIDLVFHGKGDQLEHDFRIAAGGNPDQVRFSIEGTHGLALDAAGNLEISLTDGKVVFERPTAYQESSHGHEPVKSRFVLNSDQTVQFRLGPYDRNRELVIDPVFSFSTYLAGSSADNLAAVTTDSSGNIYVTGFTGSLDFPIVNGVQPTYSGGPDAFVSKFDPTGHTLLYSTFLGGSYRNYGNAIKVDAKGNIIVTGTSSSNDFPHVGSVPSLTCQGNNDCFFLASLKPDGSAFNYAGLIGGIAGTAVQNGSSGSGVLAVDSAGNAYLASVTDDANFQITPGTLSNSVPGYPYNSTFILKVDNAGALAYSTIIPGTAQQNITIYLNNVFIPAGISVDGNGQVTIAGTSGPGLPSTSGVIQPTFPNNLNTQNASAGFLLQLNAKASAINYATYVPGTDTIGGLAVDSLGYSYVTGGTSESNLPVSSNAYQKTLKSGQTCTCNSGFILKMNGTGTAIPAATYLEGTPVANYNVGTSFSSIALDSNSNVFVGGMTGSTDFPLVDPFVSLWVYGESISDMVLAEMKPDLSALLFGSFLSSTDQVFPASEFSAVAVDHQNNLIVVGQTLTTDFPTTKGAFQSAPPTQARHGFITKLNMAVAAPSVCPDSWTLNFGSVPAKNLSTQIVHVKNCGNALLHLKSIVSSAASVTAKNSCGAINAGSICPVSVTFAPRDSSLVGGTLTFSDDAVISPQVISFSGQGVASLLSPSSGSVGFGHLLVNTTGAGNNLLFSNNGNATLNISSVAVDGDFAITQNSCRGTVQPNNACGISIKFSPSAAGIRTGTLFINSNDPVYPHAGMSLNGVGDTVYAAPLVSSLGSPSVQIKNGAISVQVSGANFYPASVMRVNGKPQATTYSDGGQLQATLDSTVTGAIGEIFVSVFNPAPGGGTSVAIPLTRYQVLNLDAAFLATVPGSSLVYASIPSSATVHPNTVIPINPSTGTLGTPIPVGQNPRLLAASSDGKYLFVETDQDQTVQRINLSSKKVDRTFPFPPSNCSSCGAETAVDLKGIPSSPQEVVIAFNGYGGIYGEVALYNDAGLVNYVPTSLQTTVTFYNFAFAGSPLTIYALPFTTVQNPFFSVIGINAQGLQYTPPQGGNYGGNNTTGSQVVSDGTLLYTSSGEVWNPASQTQVGSFPVTAYNDWAYLAMDVASGHIFSIGFQPYLYSSSLVLSAYGQKSFAVSGELAFPQVNGVSAQSLVRWGSKGFAFVGPSSSPYGQAPYLLTSSVATSATSNPVPHVSSISPRSTPKGGSDFQLTLNGQGFAPSSVVRWNGSALATTYTAGLVLTATVPAADLAVSGTASITVYNPAPGGGTSNAIKFIVAPLVPLLSYSSSAVTFPTQKVGTSSTARTVAVQNPGTAPLSISGVKITGTNPASFSQTNNCGSTLAPGANCVLSIAFKPTSIGTLSASVSFTDNAAGSPQAVSLTGTGD